MTMHIRKGTPEDVTELGLLYNKLIEHLDATKNYPCWKKDIYPTSDDAETAIMEDVLYVAEQDSKIAGTIMLRHKPEDGYRCATWNTPNDYDKIYVIYTLAVHPDYLNQGVAVKLLDFAENKAREEGNISRRLDVVKGNVPAIRLYQKCGFQYIDTVSLGYEEYELPCMICLKKFYNHISKRTVALNKYNSPQITKATPPHQKDVA